MNLLFYIVFSCVTLAYSLVSPLKYGILNRVVPLSSSNQHLLGLWGSIDGDIGTEVDNGVSLLMLQDFEQDGEYLSKSIQKWLNDEWLYLEVHNKIGKRVKEVYISGREEQGIVDLGEMLMTVGTELESFDMEDAFVNAWDIGNKVADLLMYKLDRELIACAGDISSIAYQNNATTALSYVSLSTSSIKAATEKYDAAFVRYTLMRDFLEGNIDWSEMMPVFALCLGFREQNGEIIRLPHEGDDKNEEDIYSRDDDDNWNSIEISQFPNFSDCYSSYWQEKLEQDIPIDEKSTDLLLEQLVGLETFNRIMKPLYDTDKILRRRITLTRWMYMKGWLEK